jgi:transglutaminase-like putative cysteine protease
MAAQRSSPLVCIARAGLTVSVALGLTTVLGERAWLGAALFAAVAPHAVLAWADHRKVPAWAAALIVLGAAFVFTLYAIEPHTTRHGLPTSDTLRQYSTDLGDAAHTLRTAVVPVPAVGSALLLALVALWVAGAIAEWSARHLDASLGAIGPSLVLFVAIAALGDGGWTGVTIAYGFAVAFYLVALHQAEMTERRSWFHSTTGRGSRLLQGGVLGALGIVLVAAILAPLLPGAKSDPWFDYRSLGKGSGGGLLKATTPIVSIQSKLLQDPDHEVFTVDIGNARPAYWRVIALDKYDGTLWTLEDTGEPAKELGRPAEPARFDELVQKFTIRGSEPHWLPAAYYPVEINLEHALAVSDSATVYLKPNDPISDLSYEVTSAIPVYSETQKLAAPPVFDRRYARDLQLPANFPDDVRELAQRITRSATSPWAKAEALAGYFTGGLFTYNAEVARSHTIRTLHDFLFVRREGYCEQFASAFAAMARSVGLPTRIAVGYSYGAPQDGIWVVKNKDAHAWPEVYFTGLGWVALEPTPGRGANAAGGTGDPTTRPDETAAATASGPTTTGTTAPGATGPTSATTPHREPGDSVALGDNPSSLPAERHPVRQFFVALGIVVLAAIVAALIGIVVLIVIASRRTWRRRHGADTRDRVLGAWAQALDHLAEAGVEPKPSATPIEFALRHAPAHGAGDAGPALMELAQLQTAALFAPEEPTREDADRAWQHVDRIDRALDHTMSALTRWRRRLDPRRVRPDELTTRYA